MPAALPLWVLTYTLGIWGGAALEVRWAVARWALGGALIGLLGSGFCDRGKGCWLLLCALALGGVAQARRAQVLEIPALTSIGEPAARTGAGELPFSALLVREALAPDAQWLCIGWIGDAATATAQGVLLRVEVTALRQAEAEPESAWYTVSPPLQLAVSVRGSLREPLWPGSPVRLRAALRSPRAAQNPGAIDRVRHAAAVGIHALASVEPEAIFPWSGPRAAASPLSRSHRAWLQLSGQAARLRTRLLAQLAQSPALVSPASSLAVRSGRAIVAALVLGERGPLLAVDNERRAQGLLTVDDSFRRAGIYHVLSVSGLHLAVVAWIFYRLLTRLRLWLPAGTGIAHRSAALAAVPPTLFYALLTGAELATQRAALAAVLCLLAIRCGRRAALSQALAGAVLAMTFPAAAGPGTAALLLGEPALLLSIAATLAIAFLRPLGGLPQRWRSAVVSPETARGLLGRLRSRWPRMGRSACRGAWRLAESSLAALLATLPICAYCFSELQGVGVLGNLGPGLLGEFVVLPLGIFGCLLGLGWPAAGKGLLAAAITAGQGMAGSAAAIAGLTGPLFVPAPHPLLALLFWLGLVLGACGRRLGYWGCGLAVSIYLIAWRLPTQELRVTVLDVGQGDAIVIELPAGGVMVVDAGLATAGAGQGTGIDQGARVVVPFLRQRGYRRIDLLIASHPHPDHIGGLAALMTSFPVGELWSVPQAADRSAPDGAPPDASALEPQDSADPSWRQLLQLARQRGIAISAPRSQHLQGVELAVLAPCRRVAGSVCVVESRPDWPPNDNSLVLRLTYAGRSILLPGDIELAGELALLDRHAAAELHAEVLKAPHHCSQTSSSESLVAAVRPQWVVCSVGAYNRYRFPHAAVTARYLTAGSRVLRTDADGAVEFRIDAAGQLRSATYARPP